MARSASSKRWLQEHAGDAYVKKRVTEGFRSRAAYKLLEIQRRDRVLRSGMQVVDLGAAPGGWTQVAARVVGPRGRVVACDVLPIAPLAHVTVVRGDLVEERVLAEIEASLAGSPADVVLSDMAPAISGVKAVDQPRAMALAELALDCAARLLAPGGTLLVKVFQGEGVDAFTRALRGRFSAVVVRKPAASRGRSAELYLLARGHQNG